MSAIMPEIAKQIKNNLNIALSRVAISCLCKASFLLINIKMHKANMRLIVKNVIFETLKGPII